MSAKRIYSNKKSDENKSIAMNIAKAIRKALSGFDKNALIKGTKVNVQVWGHGAHPFGSASLPTDYIDYGIEVEGYKVDGLGYGDVRDIFNHLFMEFPKSKGYIYEKKECRESYWDCVDYAYFDSIKMLAPACKDFTKILNLLDKHKGCYRQAEFKPYDFYEVGTFGKRGVYDTESDDRVYTMHRADYCKMVYNTLKTKIGAKDSVKTEVVTNYNEEDKEYSRYYEVECYGSRQVALKVSVFTPKGKLKYTTEI